MNKNLHDRAEKLIAQERIEGISQTERDWLAAHLGECPVCAQVAQQTTAALRALRGLPVLLPRGLAERTQFRVQLRAQEMREREPRRRLLWIMCVMSWALGIAAAIKAGIVHQRPKPISQTSRGMPRCSPAHSKARQT